jgi:hypothetical protein
MYEGQQGKEKIVRNTDDLPTIPCSGMRLHEPATGNNRIHVTLEDVFLQVRYRARNIIKEEISCGSEFILGVMDQVGRALQEGLFKWVKPNEWIYLLVTMLGAWDQRGLGNVQKGSRGEIQGEDHSASSISQNKPP